MKKLAVLIVLIYSVHCFSQTPNPPTSAPTPAPTPQTQPQTQPNPNNPNLNRRSIGSLSKAEEDLALIEEQRLKDEKRKQARQTVDELYRKPTKKELLLVAIDNDLRSKYAEFLKQSDTGLFKFLNQSRCGNTSTVVQAGEDCLNNTLPGAGASFSFRINSHRIPQLADLSFTENMFVTVGQWIHGLLLDIGDVPLDKVSLQSIEVEGINKFPTSSDIETAKETEMKLLEGIKQDGIVYRRLVPAKENTTYLLRSIAYRGTLQKSANGLIYNELDYDKRKDIVVAFRIIQTDSVGNLTIIWKQLSEKDSPKIEIPKSE